MRNVLCILGLTGLVLTAPLSAEVIYKWVDANGQPHFSDLPRDGAVEVFVAPPQSYTPVATGSSSSKELADRVASKADDKSGDRYKTFAITSPSVEETIWNTGGTISVSLTLRPALASGHTIRLMLDGRQKLQLGPGVNRVSLTGIERGEHQLQAQVVTQDRQVVTSTSSVTFFYKQTAAGQNRAAPQPRPFQAP
jgi:hypothetical protein